MTDVIVTVESPAEVGVGLDLKPEVGVGFDSLAVERVPDEEEAVRNMIMTVSVDDQYGEPSVDVTKTEVDGHVKFDLAFSNLRGNGITGIDLISTVGLKKTYRVTTDSGDYYDMELEDGNGIASINYNADDTVTFSFTDGSFYTTPRLLPYFSVGDVEELAPGSSPTVTITGTHRDPVLNFGIPSGGAQIDDSDISQQTVWSSHKVNQVIQNSAKTLFNTTEGWNSTPLLVSANQVMYVYTDGITYGGLVIPRIKIGDGTTYLIDLPYLNEAEIDHINNQLIHVSTADRTRWNNKVTTYEPSEENLVITKD